MLARAKWDEDDQKLARRDRAGAEKESAVLSKAAVAASGRSNIASLQATATSMHVLQGPAVRQLMAAVHASCRNVFSPRTKNGVVRAARASYHEYVAMYT